VPTREELHGEGTTLFRRGEADKADLLLFERPGQAPLVVKDFAHKSAWVRTVGRFMVSREVRAYRWLGEVPGIPRLAGRIDAHALAVERIEGMPLAFAPDRTVDGKGKLKQLRGILDRMHALGVVHLDLRGRENVILDPQGKLFVVDLASAVCLRPGSWRHRLWFGWLSKMDEAAYLKWKTIVEAGPFTEEEQRFIDRFRKLRPLWFHRRQAWRGKTRPPV
jgi:RIO-like serine/threonine protein kinase